MNKYKIIRKAIEDADRGLFFVADHGKQTLNVIKQLELNGFRIVPYVPDKKMISTAIDAIKFGTNDPAELVKEIYQKMLDLNEK